jgi:hypothetical protein
MRPTVCRVHVHFNRSMQFSAMYRREPGAESIRRWFNQFRGRGSFLKQKSPARTRTWRKDAESIRAVLGVKEHLPLVAISNVTYPEPLSQACGVSRWEYMITNMCWTGDYTLMLPDWCYVNECWQISFWVNYCSRKKHLFKLIKIFKYQ